MKAPLLIAVLFYLAFPIAGCSSDEVAPDPVPFPLDASPDHRGDVAVADAGAHDVARTDAEE